MRGIVVVCYEDEAINLQKILANTAELLSAVILANLRVDNCHGQRSLCC